MKTQLESPAKDSRSLVFADGSSNKFWKIELDGSAHTVTFGRVGTNGQTQTKSFASDDAARKSYDKLVAEKTKKGYIDAGGAIAPGGSSPVKSVAAAITAVAAAAKAPKSVKKSPVAKPPDSPAEPPETPAASAREGDVDLSVRRENCFGSRRLVSRDVSAASTACQRSARGVRQGGMPAKSRKAEDDAVWIRSAVVRFAFARRIIPGRGAFLVGGDDGARRLDRKATMKSHADTLEKANISGKVTIEIACKLMDQATRGADEEVTAHARQFVFP